MDEILKKKHMYIFYSLRHLNNNPNFNVSISSGVGLKIPKILEYLQ